MTYASARCAACLGVPVPGVPDPGYPYVLVADDLAPADTALLDPATVLAIVTERGGPTSHTAVLARSRGIPAVVGCGAADTLVDGDRSGRPAFRTVVREPGQRRPGPAVATMDGTDADPHGHRAVPLTGSRSRCWPTSADRPTSLPRSPRAPRASGSTAPSCCSWTPPRRPTRLVRCTRIARCSPPFRREGRGDPGARRGRRQAAAVPQPGSGTESGARRTRPASDSGPTRRCWTQLIRDRRSRGRRRRPRSG